MKADNPVKHKSSDHQYAMAVPINISKSRNTRDYTTRTVRPTPETAKRAYGAWMLSENWESVEKGTNPTEKVQ